MRMLLMVAVLFGAQDSRAPAPDKEAQKTAQKEIRKNHAADYAKTEPADRVFLAKKLYERGRAMTSADAAKFAHLGEARDAAIQGGEAWLVAAAVDELSAVFQIDGPAMKSQALQTTERFMKMPDVALLSKLYLKLSEEAIATERYDIAGLSAAMSNQHARKAKSASLQERATAREKEIAEYKGALEKAKQARTTLASAADHAEANLTLGRWLALYRGDWTAGVPHLLKGSDAGLKAIAEAEQADDDASEKVVALADLLWDRSSSEKGVARAGLRNRSLHWYETAYGRLATDARDKVERRIISWRSERGWGWESVSSADAWAMKEWPLRMTPKAGEQGSHRLEKMPLGTFDALEVRLSMALKNKDCSFGVQTEKGTCLISIQNGMVVVFRKDTADTQWKEEVRGGSVDTSKRELLVEIAVVQGNFVVTIDGEEKVKAPTGENSWPTVVIQAGNDWVTIHEVRLRYRR